MYQINELSRERDLRPDRLRGAAMPWPGRGSAGHPAPASHFNDDIERQWANVLDCGALRPREISPVLLYQHAPEGREDHA